MNDPLQPPAMRPGPRAPRWLRYGWAVLVTVSSLGGWIVDHCRDTGPVGSVLSGLWGARHPAPAPQSPGPMPDREQGPPGR